MAYWDKQQVWQAYERHRVFYTLLAFALYLLINNGISASSVWMEHNRGGNPGIVWWEPWVWEYTSAVSTLVLLPFYIWWFRWIHPTWHNLKQQLLLHGLASVLFSLVHVGLMVGLREVIYSLAGGSYNFGPWLRELWYEYRKDAWGYVFMFTLFHAYRFIYRRLKGEADWVEEAQVEEPNLSPPSHLLVKKLDREFILNIDDIEWFESSGNYVNLYCKGRIYPLRSTLQDLVTKLEEKGVCRVHRRFAVQLAKVDHITQQSSGDGEVILQNGTSIALSRRYKDGLRQRLGVNCPSSQPTQSLEEV